LATKAYVQKELLLQDDTEVVLKPLAIGRLRRFMQAWSWIDKMEPGDDGFDVFINCCGIALEDNFKGKFDALKSSSAEQEKGQFLSEEYKNYLEDVLDIETIYVVIEVCGGIKLNDPKLTEALLAESQ
jgi:hypothetical protein